MGDRKQPTPVVDPNQVRPPAPPAPPRRQDVVYEVALEFIAYYSRGGGCSNCGGLPHTDTCFVGRFSAALGRPAFPPNRVQREGDLNPYDLNDVAKLRGRKAQR